MIADIFYNMDSERILCCYRNDEVKKPFFMEADNLAENTTGGHVYIEKAFLPCTKRFLGRTFLKKQDKVFALMKDIYMASGATELWLSKELCEYFGREEMDLPECLYEEWIENISFFHTLIFSDDEKCRVASYLQKKTENVAALCVVCYEKDKETYEDMAQKMFWSEGLVLQVFTYEELSGVQNKFLRQVVLKGRGAVLDFEGRKSFWDKRIKSDMIYYSFWDKYGLILDTCKKNGYNTLTK